MNTMRRGHWTCLSGVLIDHDTKLRDLIELPAAERSPPADVLQLLAK
jgi:hypothetical protein